METELVEEWRERGCTISMISQRGQILYDAMDERRITDEQKESKNPVKKYALRIRALRSFFHEHKDATIIALALPADCFAGIIAPFTRKKVVVSERNDPRQYPQSKIYRLIRNICFNLADTCIFQTKDAMRCFNKAVQKKGVIIPNPINGKIDPYKWHRKDNSIIAVGRLNPQKNYPMLIEAFAMFSAVHPEYQLNIYGEGALKKELEQYCSQLHIEGKVTFNGFVDNIFSVMAEAAMFVSSSDYEGISNAMLEALAIGIPTICTDCPVGGSKETIHDGENGLLVPVGDAKALYEAMSRVADDEAFAQKISMNAQTIKQKYPLHVIASKWLDVM